MSGWHFNATGAYARGTPSVTAYPFTWMIQAAVPNLGGSNWYLAQICKSSVAGDGWSFRAQSAGSTIRFLSAQGATNSFATPTTTMAANTPFIAVAVATSATSRKIVIDGDLAGAGTNTTSSTPAATIDRISFGRKDDSAQTGDSSGTMFLSALWDVALTDAEVVALGQGAWPPSIRPKSLINFWPDWVSKNGVIQDWTGRCPLTLNLGTSVTTGARRSPPPVMARPSNPRPTRSSVTMVG